MDGRPCKQCIFSPITHPLSMLYMCVLVNAMRVCFDERYTCVFRWTLYMCVSMNAIHVCFDECYTCVLYMCVSMNAIHVCFDECYTCVLYMCVLMNAIHVCFDECYTCVLYMCVSMNAIHVCFDERCTCAFWWRSFHIPERRRKQKGLRVSNFALLLVVFKWHLGSEGVKPHEKAYLRDHYEYMISCNRF